MRSVTSLKAADPAQGMRYSQERVAGGDETDLLEITEPARGAPRDQGRHNPSGSRTVTISSSSPPGPHASEPVSNSFLTCPWPGPSCTQPDSPPPSRPTWRRCGPDSHIGHHPGPHRAFERHELDALRPSRDLLHGRRPLPPGASRRDLPSRMRAQTDTRGAVHPHPSRKPRADSMSEMLA